MFLGNCCHVSMKQLPEDSAIDPTLRHAQGMVEGQLDHISSQRQPTCKAPRRLVPAPELSPLLPTLPPVMLKWSSNWAEAA